MKQAKAVKQVFQRCRAARQLGTEGGLTHVLVPTNPDDHPRTCEDWEQVDCPTKMAQILIARNKAHFGQSQGCTLTSSPLDFTMKFTATCHQADAILEGKFLWPPPNAPAPTQDDQSEMETENLTDDDTWSTTDNSPGDQLYNDETDTLDPAGHQPLHLQRSELPEIVQLLIDKLRYMTKPDSISPELTEEEYKGKIKAWDERTSTSPTSNMHLGHLKAYWAEHTLAEGSKEATHIETVRRRILDGHLLLLNYAIQFGYSFRTWQRIVNNMLENNPGLPKIHRLRVIHLYEADYNLILGVKWRQVLHHATSKGLINDGCYGSLPGKEATDALLI